MKRRELKSLVKTILKEIYMEPENPEGLMGVLSSFGKQLQSSHPELTDISKGHKFAHKIILNIKLDVGIMVRSLYKDDEDEFESGTKSLITHTEQLGILLPMWAKRIYNHSPDIGSSLDRIMKQLSYQMDNQLDTIHSIFESMKTMNDLGKMNYINVHKQLKHLDEIFESTKQSIDDLFQIGLNSGYGKPKK